MEMIAYVIIALLVALIAYFISKNYRLKQDIYDFTKKLDTALNRMLNDQELMAEAYQSDDLWGMVYERLVRLSHMYTHKNAEVTEEKEKLKELVSDISHQTKTPIANVKLYLELLTDKNDKIEEDDILKKLGGQVDKLDFLLHSMVKMSRLETGTIRIQKQLTCISETLAAAIGAVVPRADNKHIQIHVDYDEKLLVKHDKKWTSEALKNILKNCLEHTKPGGSISIRASQDTLACRLSITDTGSGFDPEDLPHVFERFYRGKQRSSCQTTGETPQSHSISAGVGIGLALAQSLIVAQGGRITASNNTNPDGSVAGARFDIPFFKAIV